jgi:hypothetical protein
MAKNKKAVNHEFDFLQPWFVRVCRYVIAFAGDSESSGEKEKSNTTIKSEARNSKQSPMTQI